MGAELQAESRPGVEVGLHVDTTAGALVPPHTPELRESRSALDTWLVGARSLVDVVGIAIGGDFTLLCGALGSNVSMLGRSCG